MRGRGGVSLPLQSCEVGDFLLVTLNLLSQSSNKVGERAIFYALPNGLRWRPEVVIGDMIS